jgi:hypothetical protein
MIIVFVVVPKRKLQDLENGLQMKDCGACLLDHDLTKEQFQG